MYTFKKNILPYLIFFILIFNIILFVKYLYILNNKVEFKEIKPLFNHKLEKYIPKEGEKIAINPSVVSDKTIYLTFDDGPSYLTENILNTLKEENVPATFFVTSKQIEEYKNDIIRMKKENHTVALHTSTHNYSYLYSSVDNYFNDLNDIKNKVYNIIYEESYIIRLPGGSSNTVSKKYSPGIVTQITNKLTEEGYLYYDWNIDSEDASGSLPKEKIYENVINRLHSGTNIVLMHDAPAKKTTAESLKDIITWGKNNGYTFSKITNNTPLIHHHINN